MIELIVDGIQVELIDEYATIKIKHSNDDRYIAFDIDTGRPLSHSNFVFADTLEIVVSEGGAE